MENKEENVSVENEQTTNENQNVVIQNTQKPDTKLYRILSYIGFLWVVGLCVNEKNEPEVKFHVGQGIILTIAQLGANAILSIIGFFVGVIFGLLGSDFLIGISKMLFGMLNGAVSIAAFALMIIGIINANNNENKELPVIGRFAFYK